MKICFVGPFSNIHTQRWVNYFANHGHDVHVISNSPIQDNIFEIKLYQFKTYRTGNYLLNLFAGIISLPLKVIALKKLLTNINPQIVHVHYINELAFYLILTGFRPIVMTAWGSDILISPFKSKIRMKVLKYILKKADLITCDAEHLKDSMVNFGANPDKVKIIFYGTDVEKYNSKYFNSEIRDRFVPKGGNIVISTRNHDQVYDIETLIKAIPAVLMKFPDTLFLIGGSGPLTEKLKDLVLSLKVEKNVHFLGRLSQDELPRYLASSDIYVSTALSDGGLAGSTAEAMSSGLPVIITDVGNNSQWVKNDIQGFLFPAKNSQSLAEKISQLLENKYLRQQMGTAGRQMIFENNNFSKQMSKMEKIYQELIGEN